MSRAALRILFFALIFHAGPALAQWNHTEDFSTTAFRDSVETTADWNTVDGELKLYPFAPTLTGTVYTGGYGNRAEVRGDLLYLADGGFGLRVIDVSDPAAPVLLGEYDSPLYSFGLFVDGHTVYLADSATGLLILDASDPAAPVPIGSYDTPGIARAVWVEGPVAYVADDATGLVVLDVSNPAEPALLGTYDSNGLAYDVQVEGNVAYVADDTEGLLSLDVTDPAAPLDLGALDTPGESRRVAVSGDLCFVGDGSSGLAVIDVSDPAAPASLGSVPSSGSTTGIFVRGNTVYLADGSAGLRVIDVTDPGGPVEVHSFDTTGLAEDVVVTGNQAYVVDGPSGVHAVEVSQDVEPTVAGFYGAPWTFPGMAVDGRYAYLALNNGSLDVLDLSDPANPIPVGSASVPQNGQGVDVAGNHAYLAHSGGFYVMDVSDPASPVQVGALAMPTACFDVVVRGDLAYVGRFDGFEVVDVSDPTSPASVGSLSTTGSVQELVVDGAYAYLTMDTIGVMVVDVSDPTNPVAVTSHEYAGGGIAKAGDHLYVANGSDHLWVFDASDPTALVIIDSWISYQGQIVDVVVSGNQAYVADYATGLLVLDVSDPSDLQFLHLATPAYNNPTSIMVYGNHLLVREGVFNLVPYQFRQSDLDVDDNLGQTRGLGTLDYPVIAASISANVRGAVDIEFKSSGSWGWEQLPIDGSHFVYPLLGPEARWRAKLHWGLVEDPGVDLVEARWYAECGPITSITDVPGDQGGRVYVGIHPSGYDHASVTTDPVARYDVYRRVDDPALAAEISSAPKASLRPDRAPAGIDATMHEDVIYVRGGDAKAAAQFPPGVWAQVASLSATQSDAYLVEVPTVADSNAVGSNPSVFLVTTHTTTPSNWFISLPDSGWSVDNIAPGAPTGVAAAYQAAGVTLDWDDAPEADFQYYRVYRGGDQGFVPGPANLVQELAVSAWTDPATDPWEQYYKVTVLDHAGNESEPGSPSRVSGVGDNPIPVRTALLGAVPNPFNPTTKLSFEMAVAGHARLVVYDAAGRRVATLVDEGRTAGRHEVAWDGRDDAGRTMAAGVYLYRMETGGFTATKRMVLIK